MLAEMGRGWVLDMMGTGPRFARSDLDDDLDDDLESHRASDLETVRDFMPMPLIYIALAAPGTRSL
jgi:hypothetical protein